jgi:hypothetical protein
MAEAESESGNSNRRSELRHLACMLAQVQRGDNARSALIRDISTTGALLFTRTKLQVGEVLKLSLFLEGDSSTQPVVTQGKVVRSESRPRQLADVWTESAAIQFDSPLNDLSGKLEQIAAKQKATFGNE